MHRLSPLKFHYYLLLPLLPIITYLRPSNLQMVHANRHKLYKRTHAKWHKFCIGYRLSISAGIQVESSQAAEDIGCYKSSISAKATM